MTLTDLSDAQLLESLRTLCAQGRAVLARLLAHLVEVEERRLHLEAACASMFQFCVQRLGMSEDEACRRIQVARLVRRFPELLVRTRVRPRHRVGLGQHVAAGLGFQLAPVGGRWAANG